MRKTGIVLGLLGSVLLLLASFAPSADACPYRKRRAQALISAQRQPAPPMARVAMVAPIRPRSCHLVGQVVEGVAGFVTGWSLVHVVAFLRRRRRDEI